MDYQGCTTCGVPHSSTQPHLEWRLRMQLKVTILLDGEPIRLEVFRFEDRQQVTAQALSSHISENAMMPSYITVLVERVPE